MNCKKQNGLIFVISALLYVFNRYTKFHIPDESLLKYIWDYHFTDFLCQIVFFALLNLFLESFDKEGIYNLKTMIGLGMLCTSYWEIVVLFIRTGTTFDIYDFIAYFLGGFVYFIIMKVVRKNKHVDSMDKEK